MRSRILLGFLIAPSLLPLVAFCIGAREPGLSLGFAGLYAIFTYGVAILAGGPLLYLYLRNRWFRWWQYAIGGLLLGFLPSVLFEIMQPGPLPFGFLFIMACFGSASAVIFWSIIRWGNSWIPAAARPVRAADRPTADR